jgi:CHAT domain-containing protein
VSAASVLREAGVARVAVSAPSILTHLPFEAFPLDGARGGVLGDEFAISYLPSLGLGIDLARREPPRRDGGVVLVGYADPDLPQTATELQALERLYGRRARLVPADRLSKADVLEELRGDVDYVHFATHGTFDPLDPLRSALHLVRDPQSDRFRITARDLAALEFRRSPVVTLSACSSALTSYGPTNDCDGLIGSLLRAGARCVIGSRWPVYDSTAARFMTGLHARFAAGKTSAQSSLHETQSALRRDGSRVEDWAAFSYLGTPS